MVRKNDFDDLPDENFGALGGLGTDVLEKVTQKLAPDGLHTICYCEYCGTKNAIVSNWQEVITGSMGFVARDWFVEDGLLYPRVGCANPGCRREIGIRFTPAELARYTMGAVEQGFATPQQVGALKQQIAQSAGARR